jgi:hypothetical protein
MLCSRCFTILCRGRLTGLASQQMALDGSCDEHHACMACEHWGDVL